LLPYFLLLYFALTLFVSAALLFLVQPMVGKMILPKLGGTPAVWNTCMVFFQAVLLVGYAYTHTLSTWHSRNRQLLTQIVILLLPFFFLLLPFTLDEDWRPPQEDNPIFSVLWLLLGMVGLPFFVVATSAPLLQKWFASTGHPAGKDPYFLYGASNLGSMLALLLYPLAVEPLFGIPEQTWLWTVGYGVLVAMVLGCMALVYWVPIKVELASVPVTVPPAPVLVQPAVEPKTAIKSGRKLGRKREVPAAWEEKAPVAKPSPQEQEVTWLRRLRWLGLAAVPSSLMLGVTTHLTTDIAAIPFFWVLPLALYLLTFILVFSRWPVTWTEWPHTIVLYVQPFLLVALILVMTAGLTLPYTWMEFAFHVVVFFTTTLMCHGELAKDRPSTRYLTEFYLWMSLGGVLGGLFNALFAPLVFKVGVIEYPLAMVLACLLRPYLLTKMVLIPGDTDSEGPTMWGLFLDFFIPFLIAAWTLIIVKYSSGRIEIYAKALMAVTMLAMSSRPIRFGLALGMFMLVIALQDRQSTSHVFEDRSFFGFVRVRKDMGEDSTYYNTLIHGGINHGQQSLDPARRRDSITYFHPTGGIGQIFQEWHDYRVPVGLVGMASMGRGALPLLIPAFDPPYSKFDWPDARIYASLVGLGASPLDPWGTLVDLHSEPPYAVVGLGIGTLASHAKPLQHVTFYEIDPIIKRLSLPPQGEAPIFYYLQDAADRGSHVEVILGDGRLSLQHAPEHYYHILVLDAFSSDAIPVHLLTKEAVQLYLTRLAEGGVLIFNTTNRYVDITGVLADIAKDLDLNCYAYGDYGDASMPTKFGSDWVVMQRKNLGTRGKAFNGGPPMEERVPIHSMSGRPPWYEPDPLGGLVWTDRYSNLLRVLRWGR
jgi:hypothetical protein